ncbi:MAG: amidohydrolase family protein [Bacteroidota bacterium]
MRGIVAYNTDSHVIPTTRSNGILIAQVTPQGGIVSGRSSIVQLDAWNWEDAAIKMDEGIHMNWPRRMFGPRWWLGETNPRPNPRYAQTVQAIRQTLSDGQTYAKTKVPETTNLKMEAMRGLYDGSVALYLHADRAKDIVLAANLLKEYGVQKIVLVGGAQAYYIKDFLKENNIAVILRNVHSLPSREDEDVDMPYRLPGMLHKAGVKVALGYASHSSARNLGFFAGTAATYGLDKEEALACITLHPAQILGIDDQVGTVESGKNATFFVSEGDALDMRTQSVVHAFIDGREIDLNDKHKMLYERFSKKYEQMKK